MRVVSARVAGNLDCGRVFFQPGAQALTADGLIATGNVLLDYGFVADGGVGLFGAEIRAALSCRGGSFLNPNGIALNCERTVIGNGVFVSELAITYGVITFARSKINHLFICSDSTFVNDGGICLVCDQVSLDGTAMFGAKFVGYISLAYSTISQVCDFKSTQFLGKHRNGLIMLGATIGGSLDWTDVKLNRKTVVDLSSSSTFHFRNGYDLSERYWLANWPRTGH